MLLRCGASCAFTCESQWEQDLRYYQHVAFAGSFPAALPRGRTTGIRPSCFCASWACKTVPALVVPVPRPSLRMFAGVWEQRAVVHGEGTGTWEKTAPSPAPSLIRAAWTNLCTSSGNSVRYMLAVRCISLRAMAGFLWELIQVGSGHRGKSV